MNETTVAGTKSKPPRAGTAPFGLPTHEMFDMEVPEAFRAMAGNGAAHAKDAYTKAKAATEEATELLQDSYAAAAQGTTAYNLKVFEIACVNTTSIFDYARALLSVRSPTEFIELSAAQARRQCEMISAQNKELWAIAQKAMTEAAGPFATGIPKIYSKAVGSRTVS
jgi:phasin